MTQVGQARWGEGTPQCKAWLTTTLHQLKHDSPDTVLKTLCALQRALEGGAAAPETLARVQTALNYLGKRRAQMEYAQCQAAGYPIGSGSVESGNKVVVEARLKGAGMRWAREHVNPKVALRNVLCSERWQEDWPQIAKRLREEPLKQRQQRQRARWRAHQAKLIPQVESTAPAPLKSQTIPRQVSHTEKAQQPDRPPAKHPWRHSPIGRARFKPYRSGPDPKS